MPWTKEEYPESYKNLPAKIRNKAIEIANAILEESDNEGMAIATGLKLARQSQQKPKEKKKKS